MGERTLCMRGDVGAEGDKGGIFPRLQQHWCPCLSACVSVRLPIQAASMVPEYLTPNNGGLLSPGQLMGLSHVVFKRHGGPGVAELVLEVTPDVMIGKVCCDTDGGDLGGGGHMLTAFSGLG